MVILSLTRLSYRLHVADFEQILENFVIITNYCQNCSKFTSRLVLTCSKFKPWPEKWFGALVICRILNYNVWLYVILDFSNTTFVATCTLCWSSFLSQLNFLIKVVIPHKSVPREYWKLKRKHSSFGGLFLSSINHPSLIYPLFKNVTSPEQYLWCLLINSM